MDYFFPARRAVVRTHKYICVFIYFWFAFILTSWICVAVIQHWSLRSTWLWPASLVTILDLRERGGTHFFCPGSSRFYGLHRNYLRSQTSQTSPGSGVLTSQNPRILIKFKDFLDGGPPLFWWSSTVLYCTELSTGCTNKRTAGKTQVAGRNCFNIISDSTVQLLGEKVGNMDYFFPARRAVVRTHKYMCFHIFLNRLHFDQLTLRCSHSTLKSQINLALAGKSSHYIISARAGEHHFHFVRNTSRFYGL